MAPPGAPPGAGSLDTYLGQQLQGEEKDSEAVVGTLFGLGRTRSLAEFETFCGVQFATQKVLPRGARGGQPEGVFRGDGGGSGSTGAGPDAAAAAPSAVAQQVFQLLQLRGMF